MKKDNIIKTSVVHTCKSCSGNMTFDVATKKLICGSCGSKESVSIVRKGKHASEYPIETVEEGEKLEKSTVIKCPSCGGETILNGYETSTECEYCGDAHTVLHTEMGIVKPETMIPFKVTKDVAVQAYKKWMRFLWLAPFGMKKKARKGELTGLFSPFWDYDFTADIEYRGKQGEVRTRRTKNGTTTEVRWHNVSGRVMVDVDDAFTSGSRKYYKVLKPIKYYDFNELVAYNPSLLAGFHSEKYSIDVYDGLELVKRKLKPSFEKEVCYDIGGDRQKVTAMNIDYKNVKYRHTLLPVWVSSYSFRNKVYEFAVNGQTGKVVGKSPVSLLKVVLLILLGSAIIGAFYYIFYYAGCSDPYTYC